MGSRIGISFQQDSPLVDEVMPKAPWAGVLSIDNIRPLRVAQAHGVPVRVLRLYQIESLSAQDAINRYKSLDLSAVTHIKLANESSRSADLVWQSQIIEGLKAAGFQGGFLGFGFATGTPSTITEVAQHPGPHFPDWLPLAPLFSQIQGVALNQYVYHSPEQSRWQADLPYTGTRDGFIRNCLSQHSLDLPPVHVTECNIEPGGWKGLGYTPDQFINTVVVLDSHDCSSSGMMVRFYFTLTPYSQWQGYDYYEVIDRMAFVVNAKAGVVPKMEVVLDVPIDNQLSEPDNNTFDDCGPVCAEMVADYYGIQHENARQIKTDWTGNPDYVGYTTTGEMTQWFLDHSLPALQIQSPNPFGAILDGLSKGWPSVYLRYWDTTNKSGGHFVVARGYDPATGLVSLNNPWGGVIDTWSQDQINSNSLGGWLVTIQKTALFLDDLFEQQWKSYKPDVAVNKDAAIWKAWLTLRRARDSSRGVPTSQEFAHEDGVAQYFTNAIAFWSPRSGVTWK